MKLALCLTMKCIMIQTDYSIVKIQTNNNYVDSKETGKRWLKLLKNLSFSSKDPFKPT